MYWKITLLGKAVVKNIVPVVAPMPSLRKKNDIDAH